MHFRRSMYAVFQTGGKQYRVQAGDFIQVEKLEGSVGDAVKFNEVLFLSKPGESASEVWLGQPHVKGALVQGQIVAQGRGDKIIIVKMTRRTQYRRVQGHRQEYTQLLVTQVDNGQGEKDALSASDVTSKVKNFITQLKPKGAPRTLKKQYQPKAAAQA